MISSTGTGYDLTIRLLRREAGCTVVALEGELDIAQRDKAIAFFTTLITTGQSTIVLDLADLAFCDAAGLGILCRIRRLALRHGGWIRLAAPCPRILRLLKIVGAGTGIAVYPTVEQALPDARQTDRPPPAAPPASVPIPAPGPVLAPGAHSHAYR